MDIIETFKHIAEAITAIITAIIIIASLFKHIPKLRYFIISLKYFVHGTLTLDGKRVRCFKGLKEQRNRNKAILNGIAPELEMEEYLILDKKALLDLISDSSVFHKIQLRK